MKNILLLGNGFDLYYMLPTKYSNFLHVVNYLIKNRQSNFETVGDVFSQKMLQETDVFIKECYSAHQQGFDNTPLNKEDLLEIIKLAENNIWFLYLNKIYDNDIGWIDFEKEIGFVLKCFEKVFKKIYVFECMDGEEYIQYVIKSFDFFINEDFYRKSGMKKYKVDAMYCAEKPIGSGNISINTEKIVGKLYGELNDLAKALKLYLRCFVENSLDVLKSENSCVRLDFLSIVERVVSFNYTNTYEKIYNNSNVFHIHGEINDEIILGVNPDESDKFESIDTTFLCFKKYSQRTLYETDNDYLRWIGKFIDDNTEYRLIVMGHSLDKTDEDILEELFMNAEEIVILYHSISAKQSYITNLVDMFAKEDFDLLRKEKNLTFLSLSADLSQFSDDLNEESWRVLNDYVAPFMWG